jgi:hypothetical protein
MSTKKETLLRRSIIEYLRSEYGATSFVYPVSPYGEVGFPDVFGFLPAGDFFAFELKIPKSKHGKEHLLIQRNFLMRMRRHGCRYASFATCPSDVDRVLNEGIFLDFPKLDIAKIV